MLKEIIDRTYDQQVQELKNLVAIPSVSRTDIQPGMPLGKGVAQALNYTLDLARRLGFSEARSLDGYCGVVDYGSGKEMLMIMAHLDVVPAGPAWSSDPFKPEVRNGRLYGRGVIDDKGAAVSALYALHAVKEAGIPLNKRVRIFLGCDEELDWGCVERYRKTEPDPDMAFTPDGSYPLVHSEKSICHTTYERKLSGSSVSIDCGTASNVIPGEASAELAFPVKKVPVPRIVKSVFTGSTIRVMGKGGHASTPEYAINALQYLLGILAEQPLSGDDLAIAAALHALLGMDQHGEGFGLDISDGSGQLTLSPDVLHWDENSVRITLDCRYPFCLTIDQLLEKLDGAFAAIGFHRTHMKNSQGHFQDPEGTLCKTLLEIYDAHTGKKSTPLAIGGGTYARAFQNAVAFGIEPEDREAEAHMPDESIGLEDIRFNTLLMAEAIEKLAGK